MHRDVKPENVLISDDGDVKIADFGLVRAVAQAGITSTSIILGTAAYLSPEQVGTGAATAASDVYSLGVLTYELLTGTTPFDGDTALAVAYLRMDRDVPAPSAAIDGVPPQFDDLVRRATARDPGARYADATEMGAAVASIVEELALPAFQVPAPRNSAQHAAATRASQIADRPPRRATLALTRDPAGRQLTPAPLNIETPYAASHFAGIELNEFAWARQRARRMSALWLALLLIATAAIAGAAWTLGSNLTALLG